ncbi:MAG: Smr/MutS family protein [candidate division Zixibacteria bacterium]|nr:Smr/MutS family protein [candidate division Zixibacteria bacterium]
MCDTNDNPVEYPIDGTLDLHQFSPKETREVVLEYIAVCRERGIFQLRIVHGKGIGVQREIVRSLLDTHPDVAGYRQEGGSGGGWGATVVDLRRG